MGVSDDDGMMIGEESEIEFVVVLFEVKVKTDVRDGVGIGEG